jgi:hypothetical protein
MSDKDILFDRGIEKCGVDVHDAELEVHRGVDGEQRLAMRMTYEKVSV